MARHCRLGWLIAFYLCLAAARPSFAQSILTHGSGLSEPSVVALDSAGSGFMVDRATARICIHFADGDGVGSTSVAVEAR
jgi:hypothetical protein